MGAIKKRLNKKNKMEEDEEEENMEAFDHNDAPIPAISPKYFKQAKNKTERDIEIEEGDDYGLDFNKRFMLANPEEKYDVIPEHWNGHNIADFVDPDIMEKLEQLEKEEEARERSGFYDSEESEEEESYAEIKDLASKIRHKKAIMKA